MKVVIDTNVIVSRYLSPTGPPARIMAFWEEGRFDLLISEPILAEYAVVLHYPHIQSRHRMTVDQIAMVIEDFRNLSLLVMPTLSIDEIAEDPADNKFLECAVSGSAMYIVSGDPHLLRLHHYQGIYILTPAQFVSLLE